MTTLRVKMPRITFRIDGLKKRDFVRRSLFGAKKRFRTENRKNKTGIHHRGLPHRSSEPGQYPRKQSGRLEKSIKIKYDSNGGSLYSNLNYAGYLISGTRHMARRKMFYEALNDSLNEQVGRFTWFKIEVSR